METETQEVYIGVGVGHIQGGLIIKTVFSIVSQEEADRLVRNALRSAGVMDNNFIGVAVDTHVVHGHLDNVVLWSWPNE